ncbi:hypothetical protein [Flavobacterium silvaticum]|uniref:Uncharacterized protein n=1 Tax=Flavobacterium silvaticum TaxID=1852020 RepID=A0A972JHR8_9FLAO|nr:hypothetical protein [Flavobacterium silvaticum]NMH28230.1 hypothetical protein [Flavobacterium silvaticum]
MESKTIVVSQGRLPIWRAILAAGCFSWILYILGLDAWAIYQVGYDEKLWTACAKSMNSVGYFFAAGVLLSLRRTVRISPAENLLQTDLQVGPFRKTITQSAPELEYMSVFKNQKEQFEANLWYKGNKHYKMCAFDKPAEAFSFARDIAKKLNIDLLDATRKGDFTWIEMNETNA